MTTATARHILVETQDKCEDIKRQIEAGADFSELAREHSKCPSGQRGGDLGDFSPGQMVKAFDDIVFSADLGKVHGPVQTQFGFHLIEITGRTE
jgi:peptidyl-prolyl cis-trans isomerase C